MFNKHLLGEAENLLEQIRAAGLRLATAESCTGGLIIACLTEISGSSDVVERGLVAYANQAKTDLLGVPLALLTQHGAVSEEVARAMAEGAMVSAPVDLAVAVTGIAGPGGATQDKPVGLVHLAAARHGRPTLHRVEVFPGTRQAVRVASVRAAFALLRRQLA